MSALPALLEIGAIVAFAPSLLHVTDLEVAIMGAVLGAVFPAVAGSRKISFIGEGVRYKQANSTTDFADGVFVILLSFISISMAQGKVNHRQQLSGNRLAIIKRCIIKTRE